MSFFDTLKSMGLFQPQQGQPAQQNPYGLDPATMRQARMDALGNIGGQILAMSQQMTPDQRAKMMANADWTGGMQGNLMNAAQMKLVGDRQRKAQEDDQRSQAAREWLTQKVASLPDGQQKRNAMIYLQLGDIQKAAEAITAEPARPEYQIVDGFYVDKNNPAAPAIPVQGMPQQGVQPKYQIIDGQVVDMNNPMAGAQPVPGFKPKDEGVNPEVRLKFVDAYEKTPEVQSYNILASTLTSLANSVYDNSKVSDLNFVYGVAKALDPTSVVRESEAGMVIDAQGLDAATLGRLNSMIGGGALLPQQRLSLLNLVRSRAEALRPFVETRRQNILDIGAGIVDESFIRPVAPLASTPQPPTQRVNREGLGDLPMPLPDPELMRVE